jgi:hypothetical protein
MSPSTDVRERREFASEIKFVVPSSLAEQLSDWARARLMPDPNAGGASGDTYRITSLYFDTEAFDVFHRRDSYGRSKLRVRRYGQTELLFLERKLRTRGLLAKRRSIVSHGEIDRLTEEEPDHSWPGYWFHRRLLARGLKPVCQITYQRLARVAMTPYGPIRLTIDCDLHGTPVDELKFTEEKGSLLIDGFSVLELKFRRELPVLFKNLLQEFALNPEPFSKYRQAVKILQLAPAAGQENPAPVYA